MILVTAGAAAAVILQLCEPRLIRLKDPSAVDPSDGLFVVLNPIRDRSPEGEAEAVLKKLRAGQCESALAFLEPKYRADVCEQERNYPALTWKLRDREDKPGEVVLFYAVFRKPSAVPIPTNVWITVKKAPGGWKAAGYECWY